MSMLFHDLAGDRDMLTPTTSHAPTRSSSNGNESNRTLHQLHAALQQQQQQQQQSSLNAQNLPPIITSLNLNGLMGTGPLSALHMSMMGFNLGGGTLSQQLQQAQLQQMQEEITTIFVVGFPEDMHEREFQNMFIFCPGFEAATLKHPHFGEDSENIPQYKKQIIGFVKFRTRLDALQARDILNGRKVDAERGCVLKAEVAKKNLHTKRGLSNDHQGLAASRDITAFTPINPIRLNSSQMSNLVPGRAPATNVVLPSPKNTSSAFENYYVSMNNALMGRDMMSSCGSSLASVKEAAAQQHSSHASFPSHSDYFSVPVTEASHRGSPTSSLDATTAVISDGNRSSGSSNADISELLPSSLCIDNISETSAPATTRPLDSPRFGASAFESLLDQPPSVTSAFAPTRHPSDRGFSSALYCSDSLLPSRLSINTSLGDMSSPASAPLLHHHQQPLPSPATQFVAAQQQPEFFRSVADQNPPCNTLYVGNLPGNACEEELRMLFAGCKGFRRLSFRQRTGGPMCFVEFEDVRCAHQALVELHGQPLTNSVKGGIRLSFSKNPLGVRQNMMPSIAGIDRDPSRLIFSC
ncbi:hypothetical protein HK101_011102 [Irineochytrium annulatum]|nr:hypothetical protein HK101_011102 [Irineochytrium annulatum]